MKEVVERILRDNETGYGKIKLPELPKILDGEPIKNFIGKLFDKVTVDGEKVNIPRIKDEKKDIENQSEIKKENIENGNNKEIRENSDVRKIQTRNQELEGKTHPETEVPFERRTVEDNNGKNVEVVVPKFESQFDAKLSDELCEETDNKQFKGCNKQLKDAVEANPKLKSKFNEEQIEQIMDGETPDGYTWHHDAEKGKMQLVDSEVHAKTGHTGGKSIWGGGSENR